MGVEKLTRTDSLQSPVVTIGLTIRNSTVRQVGNFRAEAQLDMVALLEVRGYQVRVYDEQGTSGKDLSKRAKALQMLEDLRQGSIQGIGAYDVKRLTRDEFGVDGGTIARRIVEAGGLFVTRDREYDLRNEDDLLQFQFQCFIAGIDWRNVRNTFWSGLFKKLEGEPVFMRPPIGYMTERTEAPSGSTRRVIKRVTKNPDHATLMAELERLFDANDTLISIARHLNTYGPLRPEFRGRGGTTTHWSVQSLRYLLRNPIYTGTFSFGANLKKRSTVWHKYATDPQTGQPRDFRQHVPELAYWTPAQVKGWRERFDRQGPTRTAETRYPHPLSGVLECMSCGQPMVARGPRTYACTALGTLRGRQSVFCSDPQAVSPNVAAALMRQELPRAMYDARTLAAELRAQYQQHAPSPAAQRLAFLQDRVKWINQQLVQLGQLPPPSLVVTLAEAEVEMATLREEVASEQNAADKDAELAAMCEVLVESPLEAFDALPWPQQHRIYRLLFANVRIETEGVGFKRRWRLRQYRALIGGQLRTLDDAPWAHRAHPHRPDLVFETDMSRDATYVNLEALPSHIPTAQLRGLAAAFVRT
jgi:hypothetical protein